MFKALKDPFHYPNIKVMPIKKNEDIGKKPKTMAPILYRVWTYMGDGKRMLLGVLILVAVSCALGLLGPFLLGKAIDAYIVNQQVDKLGWMILILGIIYLFYSVSLFLQNYWIIGISQKTVYKLRADLFEQLHKLPISFFDKRQQGELMSRITNDMENISSTLNTSIIQICSSILTLIGTVSIMLWLSPLLTLLTFTIIPIMFLCMKWITKRTGPLFKQQQKYLGGLNGFIEESISGQSIVKTFSLEEKMIEELNEKNIAYRNAGYWAQVYSGYIPKVMNMLNNISFALIVGIGGLIILKSSAITIGVIIIFVEYSRQFTRPLNDLSNQFNTLLSAIAGAERVFEILDEHQEATDEKAARNIPAIKGEIKFKNVSFAYRDGALILDNISFTVNPGETLALVGPTGAGKTTIIQLITRFYDITEGLIEIDGKDISTIKRDSLRSHIGFVLQDTYLFEGTVRDNIRYGRLSANDEDIVAAAKMANAHHFILKLENGYDTILKTGGNGISQGQKQLLSIARAMLADPAILVLDEATSSIDTVTELKIQEALDLLMDGRTCFVVAHRLNTIRNADKILVMKNGNIIETGSHKQLLKQKGFYYDLNLYQTEGKKGSGL
ncbi:ABC transporter ATP-binding protein [Niallia sp. NCCP-28]|uniref:ABC transporter ATP-binding protein n=1 Tax=Niallia sp. NCCP-28 TaxID=2934712 RepID=UPI00207E7562|nr:ABC transporter ATP-binding protein [Niallia sp. NCCP-28]GKU84454.1 putative ABC transporter ATP-binding protein YfiC [Niallia sp. NCCP-28]